MQKNRRIAGLTPRFTLVIAVVGLILFAGGLLLPIDLNPALLAGDQPHSIVHYFAILLSLIGCFLIIASFFPHDKE